jgi:hypothetical protein
LQSNKVNFLKKIPILFGGKIMNNKRITFLVDIMFQQLPDVFMDKYSRKYVP